jgi:hypothetical protein
MVMSCASAGVDSASAAPSARPISFHDVMRDPRGYRFRRTAPAPPGSQIPDIVDRFCREVIGNLAGRAA